MPFSNVDVLVYLAIFFLVVVGTFLSIALWRTMKILAYTERLLSYADHVRGILLNWETLPLKFLDRILEVAFSSDKKKK